MTSDMSQHDSGLRVSTARSSEAVDKAAEEEQPGSAVFYSPSASQDASPASKSAFRIVPSASQSAFLIMPFASQDASPASKSAFRIMRHLMPFSLPVSLPFALCPSRHLMPFSLPVSPPFALCPSRHLIAFLKGRLAKASQRALWGVPLRAFVPPCDTSQSWILAGCI